MNIQWFPGHMTKALRMMKENAPLVDCFLYVLDARAVFACINPTFNEVIGGKPILYIINKADLIEDTYATAIEQSFKAQGKKYMFSDSKSGVGAKQIVNAIRTVCAAKIQKYKDKNVNISVRAMVIGIPNCGKSTLINSLCGNKRTAVGNRPGVTKGKQWVVLDKGIELLDTPGTLCPSFSDAQQAMHLAFLGSINDAIIDLEELSRELLAYLVANHSAALLQRYRLEELPPQTEELIKQIARVRGFLLKGGEVDYERVYPALLDDFRKGKFGKIALEY